MRAVPQVGLVGTVFRSSGNDAIRGVAEYARRFGPWQFSMKWLRVGIVALRHADLHRAEAIRDIAGLDGILYHKDFIDDEVVAIPRNIRIPVVSIQQYFPGVTPWKIHHDHRAAARMAGEEFTRLGYRHLAYCPLLNLNTHGNHDPWDRERCDAFGEFAREVGADLHVYSESPTKWAHFSSEIASGRLARWLQSLPKPVGLLAACDERARHVLLSVPAAGVRVPEEVAIIGIDNEPWAGIAPLSLSSVELDAFRAGYAAAKMLHHLMEGQSLQEKVVRIAPLRIVTRQSSAALAIDDPEVVTAVRFISEFAKRPIEVSDVVNAVVISRRGLERRFKRALNRSIQEEIRRARISRARNLLEDDAIPLGRVAAMSGFVSARAMDALFTRAVGMTPMAYRKKLSGARELRREQRTMELA